MDIRTLQIFVHVAETRSLSKASTLLSMTQPALSRQVKKLEEELGVGLLHRDGHGVSLTPAGRVLAAHAQAIVAHMRDARSELEILRGEPRGTVTLGVTPTTGLILLAPLVRTLRASYPRITLRVLEGLSGEINDWLVNGRVDAGVLAESPTTKQRHGEPIVIEDLSLIGPPDSRADAGDCPLTELARYPLILPTAAHGMRNCIQAAADRIGVELNVILEMDALSALIRLAQEGVGYTVLPDYVVQKQAELGLVSIRRIVDPPIQRTLILATSRPALLTPAALAVVESIRRQIGALTRKRRWIHQLESGKANRGAAARAGRRPIRV